MRLWQAVMAALQVFSGGSILTDLMPKAWVGMLVLVVAALQAGTIMYMKSDQAQQPEKPVEGPRHARGY